MKYLSIPKIDKNGNSRNYYYKVYNNGNQKRISKNEFLQKGGMLKALPRKQHPLNKFIPFNKNIRPENKTNMVEYLITTKNPLEIILSSKLNDSTKNELSQMFLTNQPKKNQPKIENFTPNWSVFEKKPVQSSSTQPKKNNKVQQNYPNLQSIYQNKTTKFLIPERITKNHVKITTLPIFKWYSVPNSMICLLESGHKHIPRGDDIFPLTPSNFISNYNKRLTSEAYYQNSCFFSTFLSAMKLNFIREINITEYGTLIKELREFVSNGTPDYSSFVGDEVIFKLYTKNTSGLSPLNKRIVETFRREKMGIIFLHEESGNKYQGNIIPFCLQIYPNSFSINELTKSQSNKLYQPKKFFCFFNQGAGVNGRGGIHYMLAGFKKQFNPSPNVIPNDNVKSLIQWPQDKLIFQKLFEKNYIHCNENLEGFYQMSFNQFLGFNIFP